MANLKVEGKGTTLEGALGSVQTSLEDLAEDRGLLLPEALSPARVSVSVRKQSGGAYVSGAGKDPYVAFQDAVNNAGFTAYDPDKHRVKVNAEYKGLVKAKGRPSGAQPYQRISTDLTDGLF
jgi:hypothetical protein